MISYGTAAGILKKPGKQIQNWQMPCIHSIRHPDLTNKLI